MNTLIGTLNTIYTLYIHTTEYFTAIKKKSIKRDVFNTFWSTYELYFICSYFGETLLVKQYKRQFLRQGVKAFKVIPADRGRVMNSGGKVGKGGLRSWGQNQEIRKLWVI